MVTQNDLNRARAAALNCLHDVVEARDKARVYLPAESASPTDVEWQEQEFLRWANAHVNKMREHVEEAPYALSTQVLNAIMVANAAPGLRPVKLAYRTSAIWHEAAVGAANQVLSADSMATLDAAATGADFSSVYSSLMMTKMVEIGNTIDGTVAKERIELEWANAVKEAEEFRDTVK